MMRLFFISAIWTAISPGETGLASKPEGAISAGPATAIIYASTPGQDALGQGWDGSPFASSLAKTLRKSTLTAGDLASEIASSTKEKSPGLQTPDISTLRGPRDWRIKPVEPRDTRIALVATYSKYSSPNTSQLPGAERDRRMVSRALRDAGFDVISLSNPTKTQFNHAISSLKRRSTKADMAFAYATGHGIDHNGNTCLAQSDFDFHRILQ
jgi:hypothetical protein